MAGGEILVVLLLAVRGKRLVDTNIHDNRAAAQGSQANHLTRPGKVSRRAAAWEEMQE